MNNPDHISESLEIIFWVKILTGNFFDADPESGTEKIRIWDSGWKKSAALVRTKEEQTRL
jgi:hypothetical protein